MPVTGGEPTLLPLGTADGRDRWVVVHDGRAFAVFVVEGAVRVVDALCPHRAGALVEGIVREGAVVCPSHWYAFDLATGACRTAAGFALRVYPVHERGGALYAEIPARRVRSWSEVLRAHAAGG